MSDCFSPAFMWLLLDICQIHRKGKTLSILNDLAFVRLLFEIVFLLSKKSNTISGHVNGRCYVSVGNIYKAEPVHVALNCITLKR